MPGKEWTDEEIALLGTASDAELAKKFGRSETAVAARRARLGFPPFGYQRWMPSEDELLGTAPDEEVAQKVGRTKQAVETRRCKYLSRDT